MKIHGLCLSKRDVTQIICVAVIDIKHTNYIGILFVNMIKAPIYFWMCYEIIKLPITYFGIKM